MIKLLSFVLTTLLLAGVLAAQNALQLANQTFVNVPADSSLNPQDAITIEMWIKVDSLPTTQSGIVGTWDDNNGNFRTHAIWISNNNIEFLVSRDNSESPRVITPLKIFNEWFHIAGVYNGIDAKLYINDSLYAVSGIPGILATNNQPLFIGKTETGNNGPDFFNGAIDELRIWNVPRSLDQIKSTLDDTLNAIYYQSADSGLVAYYRFDQFEDLGIGEDGQDDIRDFSIYQNHGDVVGDTVLTDIDLPTTLSGAGLTVPDGFILNQNFPNPFNPVTSIVYELPVAGRVDISVFNLLGQKVATLVSSYLSAGVYSVDWNATEFGSGIYYYRLSAQNSFTQTRKLMLIK